MRPLLVLVLVSGCVDYRLGGHRDPDGRDVPGCAEVSPAEVEFSGVAPGTTVDEPVLVDNPCTGWLELHAIELVHGDGPFDLGRVGTVLVQGGTTTEFPVRFSPPGPGTWDDVVRIETSDPDHPEIEVPVAGSAEGR